MRKLILILLLCTTGAVAADHPINAEVKKSHPAHPEDGGLRLEVNATLSDSISSDGIKWKWAAAFLTIEVAVHNISPNPITVPTTAYDTKPFIAQWPDWSPGLERILFYIDSPKFKGSPTAYAASILSPVVLAPGEYALLVRHRATITDRKRADTIKEVLVNFTVVSALVGPKEWWRGRLQTYAEIQRTSDPDKEIAEKVAYAEQRAAGKADRDFLKKVPARAAALIASADRVGVRGEEERKAKGTVLHDPEWIRRFSELVAVVPISQDNACFCAGWATAYFYQRGEMVVSVAAIHGNQLRIYWKNGGGDFSTDEAHWKAVNDALTLFGEKALSVGPNPGAIR